MGTGHAWGLRNFGRGGGTGGRRWVCGHGGPEIGSMCIQEEGGVKGGGGIGLRAWADCLLGKFDWDMLTFYCFILVQMSSTLGAA